MIETKAFLLKLVDRKRQPPVPKSVREHARHLLRHYPAYVDIEAAHKALPELYGSGYPPGLLEDPLQPYVGGKTTRVAIKDAESGAVTEVSFDDL
jgi:hypothetical protein